MIERKSEGFIKPPDELNLELNKGFKNFWMMTVLKYWISKNFKLIWMTRNKNSQKTNNKIIK
jgi:hypothetical protein